MKAGVRAVAYYLPEGVATTETLDAEFPDWLVAKIDQRTGISVRHIAAAGECASDLALKAAEKLFATGICGPADVDFLLLCTQTPDYLLPTTACLLQDRLGIPQTAGALDFNLGSSGYVYGLGMAQGLIETGQAKNVLLLTADTYSKLVHHRDKSVRTIFGDGAAATLVCAVDADEPMMGPYVYGTDGSGANYLIVPTGGMRRPRTPESGAEREDANGNVRNGDSLFMDGAEIFAFTQRVVAKCVADLLAKAGKSLEEIDVFVFHQANRYMLEHLRKRMKIPEEKFVIAMSHCGNTVSASIPIALEAAWRDGRVKSGSTVMLVGFGVGYSWGATLVRWAG